MLIEYYRYYISKCVFDNNLEIEVLILENVEWQGKK